MSNGFIKLIFVLIIGSIIMGGGLYLLEVENKKSVGVLGEKIGQDLEYVKKILEERRIAAESKLKNIIQEGQNKFEKNLGVDRLKTVDIDTSSWKTYRDEKYGFEITYPKSWIVDTESANKEFTSRGNEGKLMGGDTYWENYHWDPKEPSLDPPDYLSLYLIVYRINPSKELSIDDYLFESYGYKNAPEDIKLRKNVNTDFGIKGRYYETENSDHPVGIRGVITIFKMNNDFYVFKSSWQSRQVHEQILSTFKFIK